MVAHSCLLHAKAGPIQIGRFNIFEEHVQTVNAPSEPFVIGSHNVFEVGAVIQGDGGRNGDANVFGCKASLKCSIAIAL